MQAVRLRRELEHLVITRCKFLVDDDDGEGFRVNEDAAGRRPFAKCKAELIDRLTCGIDKAKPSRPRWLVRLSRPAGPAVDLLRQYELKPAERNPQIVKISRAHAMGA